MVGRRHHSQHWLVHFQCYWTLSVAPNCIWKRNCKGCVAVYAEHNLRCLEGVSTWPLCPHNKQMQLHCFLKFVLEQSWLLIMPWSLQEELQRESQLSCGYWWTGVAWGYWWKCFPQYRWPKFWATRQGISLIGQTATHPANCFLACPFFFFLRWHICCRWTTEVLGSYQKARDGRISKDTADPLSLSASLCFCPLSEHICWPDQPGCNMLRQHIPASVVPQPGAA